MVAGKFYPCPFTDRDFFAYYEPGGNAKHFRKKPKTGHGYVKSKEAKNVQESINRSELRGT